jgi:prephenate dehydrogenase
MTRESLYRSVGIVGTGLIGGSLGLALRRSGRVGRVLGYDVQPGMLREALRRGAVEEAADSVEDLAENCELLFIAVPVRSIPVVLRKAAPFLREGATVTDVGSVKEPVVREAEKAVSPGRHFIGGHPMAGSEQKGVEFSDPFLFQDAYYVLTPPDDCDAEVFSRLHALLSSLGARVVAMTPEQHDRAVSVISHLPHVLAVTLMNLALDGAEDDPLLRLAAGGFRDMTRIASSDSRLWLDIIVENRKALGDSLEKFLGRLEKVARWLEEGREEELVDWLERARSGRQELAAALREILADMYHITLAVENRPGVISDVTLTIGSMGINIDDLELVHPLEDGEGLLRLTLSGREEAERAAEALRRKGYRLSMGKALGGG